MQDRFGITPRLIASGGGVFEVELNGELIFSKKAEGRFPEDVEVLESIESRT
ncbi:MAG: SelT/SelW/SelH family protein [bacterium]|nr:SelT/SelW/SelH family protein [bacterium]